MGWRHLCGENVENPVCQIRGNWERVFQPLSILKSISPLCYAQTFHTPSLGDEEFEIPPIALDADPSLAVSDVVGHFEDLGDPVTAPDASFSAQYGVQALDIPVGISHGLMEQGGGLLSGGLSMVSTVFGVAL